MSVLDIDLIKGKFRVNGHFTLIERIPSSEYHAERFWSSEVLYSDESEVHKGTMKVSPNLAVEGVCKLARGDLSRLKHEAKLYADPNHLLPLQGSCVPRFLGYYECEFVWEGRDVLLGCMLLEYCGVRVPPRLQCESRKVKCASGIASSRPAFAHPCPSTGVTLSMRWSPSTPTLTSNTATSNLATTTPS